MINFRDIEIEKQTFHQHKEPISIKKSKDINKTVVSNQASFGKKSVEYLMGYKDAKVRSLCIFLSKISAYIFFFNKR